MFSRLQLKLLQHLFIDKKNKGFTLLELLVIVVIVGILSAISLPNLLNQVNKAREVEGKNGVGTIIRSQQAHHFETGQYVQLINSNDIEQENALGITINSKYYDFTVRAFNIQPLSYALVSANAANQYTNQLRNYMAPLLYYNGAYNSEICQSIQPGTAPSRGSINILNGTITCNSGNSIQLK